MSFITLFEISFSKRHKNSAPPLWSATKFFVNKYPNAYNIIRYNYYDTSDTSCL